MSLMPYVSGKTKEPRDMLNIEWYIRCNKSNAQKAGDVHSSFITLPPLSEIQKPPPPITLCQGVRGGDLMKLRPKQLARPQYRPLFLFPLIVIIRYTTVSLIIPTIVQKIYETNHVNKFFTFGLILIGTFSYFFNFSLPVSVKCVILSIFLVLTLAIVP